MNLIISRQFTTDECWDIALVLKAFKAELIAREKSTVHGVYCWVDSMVALHWISSVKTISNGFVKRRVDKIRSLVSVENWYHVDSKNNPADILSRGAFYFSFIPKRFMALRPKFPSQNY